MNCVSGDLAIFVSPLAQRDMEVLGRIIKVTTWFGATVRGRYEQWWRYEGPLLRTAAGQEIEAFADSGLRPIRPDESPQEITRDEAFYA